jgi:hypothetical protein
VTRAEWTEGVLAPAARDALARDFAKALPYGVEPQRTFLDLVDEAITMYTALRVPAQQDALDRKARVSRLAKAARSFAEAVADLDEESGERVELSIWAAEDKGPEIPDFEVAREAGFMAARVSKGAVHWLEHGAGDGGVKTRAALDGFIGELGRAYLASFGQRPSSSLNGPFAKALAPIFEAAQLDVRVSDPPDKGEPATRDEGADDGEFFGELISRTRLDRIIVDNVIGGAKLKPGRKPAAK